MKRPRCKVCPRPWHGATACSPMAAAGDTHFPATNVSWCACGRPFRANRARSDCWECRLSDHAARHKEGGAATKIAWCAACSAPFPVSGAQKFCGESCRDASPGKRGTLARCRCCGVPSSRVTCSDRCRLALKRARGVLRNAGVQAWHDVQRPFVRRNSIGRPCVNGRIIAEADVWRRAKHPLWDDAVRMVAAVSLVELGGPVMCIDCGEACDDTYRVDRGKVCRHCVRWRLKAEALPRFKGYPQRAEASACA